MGTVVSKRRSSEIPESTAVKIRVVAAFKGNCKDNSEGQQSSSGSVTESTAATPPDHKTTQLKPSVANTKFPRGVYPQRESNLSLSKDDSHHDNNHMQPYRLKLGLLTNSGTRLYDDKQQLTQSTAVVQLHPGGEHHTKQPEPEKIPDELDWLVKKGMTPTEIHTAATVIQKTVRGYQCRRKLTKEEKSAALIQRSFRQWRKNSSMLLQSNDEQMFMPANSIATTVDDAADTLQPEGYVKQFKKSKPLDSINEDTVSDATFSNEQAINSKQQNTSVTASSDDELSSNTNSDIAAALKEVLNMQVPNFSDTQMPSGRKLADMEVFGERTREHLNILYRSTILSSTRKKALKIGN